MKTTITELCSRLQSMAHDGYALYDIEVHLSGIGVENDIIITKPIFDLINTGNKSIRLLIRNSQEVSDENK